MSRRNEARPRVVSQEGWVAAREVLLTKEKAFTHDRDALAAQRRRLPMVRVEKRRHGSAPTARDPIAAAAFVGANLEVEFRERPTL